MDGYESGPDATIRAAEEAMARAADARSIILVEGISDQIALETLAERLGRNLAAEGVVVVPIGGAHAVANVVGAFAARDVRLSGVVDTAEADLFHAAAGGTNGLSSDRIHVCNRDLEDELIAAVDPAALESLLAFEGDLSAFRTLQKQPGWRERPFAAQMHRWMRSISGRSNTYADRILRAADGDRLPAPLVAAIEQA